MAVLRHLGIYPPIADGATFDASGSNETVNLAGYAIGTDAVGLGVIDADADGPITTRPADGNLRTLTVTINNTAGSDAAYLARPEDIPTAGTETVPYGALICPAGAIVEFSGLDAASWRYILRLIDGASVSVTIQYAGAGWPS